MAAAIPPLPPAIHPSRVNNLAIQESIVRLRKYQDLCSPSGDLDGILIIAGQDGKFSRVCQATLKYLFLKCNGQDLLGEQVIPYELECLDDLILFIQYSSVSIFMNAAAEKVIAPHVFHWRNVREFKMPNMQDHEVWESQKITSFIAMVEGAKRIGIPFEGNDMMIVEKWPLIQAYALDDVQVKGFFTMNHKIVNVSQRIETILAEPDAGFFNYLVKSAEPCLRRHWKEFCHHIDHSFSKDQSEVECGDNLMTFYEFGSLRYPQLGLKKDIQRGARVLFGSHTYDTFNVSDTRTPRNSGNQGSTPAFHLVAEGEDPSCGLRASRTYFMTSGKTFDEENNALHRNALLGISSQEESQMSADNTSSKDALRCIKTYCLLLEAMKSSINAFIHEYKHSKKAKSLEDAAFHAGIEALKLHYPIHSEGFPDMLSLDSVTLNFSLTVEYLDSCGRQQEPDLTTQWCFVYIKVRIRNICSCSDNEDILGCVQAGDSIILSSSEVHNVTANFPYFKCWAFTDKEMAVLHQTEKLLHSEYMLEGSFGIGKALSVPLHKAKLMFPSKFLPVVEGELRIYQKGFAFLSSTLSSPLIVSFVHHIRSMYMMPTSYDNLLVLCMEMKMEQPNNNPTLQVFPVHVTQNCIYFPLLEGDRQKDQLFALLPQWRSSAELHDIPFLRIDESTLSNVQNPIPQEIHDTFKKIACPDELFLPSIVPTLPNSLPFHSLSIPITICMGIPGSDCQSIATALCHISENRNSWERIHLDARKSGPNSAKWMEEMLGKEINNKLTLLAKHNSKGKKSRLMLSVIGFVDPLSLVTLLYRLFSSDRITIATLITNINATQLYQDEVSKNSLPLLYEQIAPGFVPKIVVTRCQDALKDNLNQLRTRIEKMNPSSEVFFLSSIAFEGEVGSLINLDCFETKEMQTFRDHRYPQWKNRSEKYISNLSEHIHSIQFQLHGTLDRNRFLAYIGSLMSQATIRSVGPSMICPLSDEQQIAKKLTGIRLAQSIAASKVSRETQQEPIQKDDVKMKSTKEACGHCWHIEGQLRFSDSPFELFEFQCTTTRGSLRKINELDTNSPINSSFQEDFLFQEDSLSQQKDSKAVSTINMTGRCLNEIGLERLLFACFPPTRPLIPLKTREKITLEEKRALQKEMAGEPVPDGYWFDGHRYVDGLGNPTEFHPFISKFIDEYITRENIKIKAKNLTLPQDKTHRVIRVF